MLPFCKEQVNRHACLPPNLTCGKTKSMNMAEKTVDIIAIGEGLVELSSNASLRISETFSKYYGGDTLCTAVSALRMGANVGYITKVGSDYFGEYLLDAWQLEGLDTSQIKLANGQNGVYFIARTSGKNQIQYYRRKTAATLLNIEDINFPYIQRAKMVYATGLVQSLSLSCEEVVHDVFEYAKQNEILVAYDPNFSPDVWSEDEAREAFENVAENIDIIFLKTECDAQALFSTTSIDEIIKKLLDLAISTIVIKEHKKGIHVVSDCERLFVPYIEHEIIDSTGCDAAFNGAFLHTILEGSSPLIAAKYANALAMLQIQKVGAIKSIPSKASVNNLFREIYG